MSKRYQWVVYTVVLVVVVALVAVVNVLDFPFSIAAGLAGLVGFGGSFLADHADPYYKEIERLDKELSYLELLAQHRAYRDERTDQMVLFLD